MTILLADLAVLALVLLGLACAAFAICIGAMVAWKLAGWLADVVTELFHP